MLICQTRAKIFCLEDLQNYLAEHKRNFHRVPLAVDVSRLAYETIKADLEALPLGGAEGQNRGWNHSTDPYVPLDDYRTVQNDAFERNQPVVEGVVWDARPTPWTISEGWIRPLYLPRLEDLSSYLKHHQQLFDWTPNVIALHSDSFDYLSKYLKQNKVKTEKGLTVKSITQDAIVFQDFTILRSIKAPKGLFTLLCSAK